jgi:hypothetical protein
VFSNLRPHPNTNSLEIVVSVFYFSFFPNTCRD